jgi:uncharacterized membrane protein YdjX (TVP38/TMEM64 family)
MILLWQVGSGPKTTGRAIAEPSVFPAVAGTSRSRIDLTGMIGMDLSGGNLVPLSGAIIEFIQAFRLTAGGILALSLLCIISGLVPIPRAAICLGAGMVFGLAAAPVILLGSILGACAAFLLARRLGREPVARLLSHWPTSQGIMRAVDAEGWRVVCVMRLGVPVPASFANYFFGVTRVSLGAFAWGTVIGSIPMIALYVHVGAVGRKAFDAPHFETYQLLPFVFTIAASVGVACLIRRRLGGSP